MWTRGGTDIMRRPAIVSRLNDVSCNADDIFLYHADSTLLRVKLVSADVVRGAGVGLS